MHQTRIENQQVLYQNYIKLPSSVNIHLKILQKDKKQMLYYSLRDDIAWKRNGAKIDQERAWKFTYTLSFAIA